MPVFTADQLRKVGEDLFQAYGVPAKEAALVSRILVNGNLAGFDSHGVIRYVQYVDDILKGIIKVPTHIDVVKDDPTITIIDGHWGFGQVIATRAAELAIGKARETGIAVTATRNCNHAARIGEYAEMAVREGMVAVIFTNLAAGKIVAPWGGKLARYATNPFTVGVPMRGGRGFVYDIANSVYAEGKIRVYHNRREHLPPGIILDNQGNPTTDTNKLYDKPLGAIMPFGGVAGHKGFGLGMVLDLLGGALTGSGTCGPGDRGPIGNGILYIAIDVSAFQDLESFLDQGDEMRAYIKDTPLAEGFTEILLPGEKEDHAKVDRERDGIYVEDETCRQIKEQAEAKGVSVPW